MRNRAWKHWEDVRAAATLILDFCAGKSEEDYVSNVELRSAVERQFEIIGEAVRRLTRDDGQTAARITHWRRIIRFRNILIHGCDIVEHDVVWEIVQTDVPVLLSNVGALPGESDKGERDPSKHP